MFDFIKKIFNFNGSTLTGAVIGSGSVEPIENWQIQLRTARFQSKKQEQ
jgi:hypothetical protein